MIAIASYESLKFLNLELRQDWQRNFSYERLQINLSWLFPNNFKKEFYSFAILVIVNLAYLTPVITLDA